LDKRHSIDNRAQKIAMPLWTVLKQIIRLTPAKAMEAAPALISEILPGFRTKGFSTSQPGNTMNA